MRDGSQLTPLHRHINKPLSPLAHGAWWQVHDHDDSRYTITYTPRKVGEYAVHVTLAGQQLPGSPFHVTVRPGPMCFRKCKVEKLFFQHAVCGINVFQFMLRDRHSNRCERGGFHIAARLTDAQVRG
jgi:hypothetical protein